MLLPRACPLAVHAHGTDSHSTTTPHLWRLHANGTACHLYCVLFVCFYTATICACMLTACDNHLHTLSIQHTPSPHPDITLNILIHFCWLIFMPLTPPSCYSFPRHTSFSAQHLSRCILFYLKYYIFPVFVCLFGCPPPLYMRLHAHGLRPSHHIYAACMLTAPPILCLYAPACLRHLPHLRNSMPPACSWQHLSVVLSSVSPTPSYMRLHAHGPRPPPPPSSIPPA